MSQAYKIDKSNIHGIGVFSTRRINKDDIIGVPLYMRYIIFPVITEDIGRKINHSYEPNSYLRKDSNGAKWDLVAIKDIAKGKEITINYNDTPWFIDNAMPWYK